MIKKKEDKLSKHIDQFLSIVSDKSNILLDDNIFFTVTYYSITDKETISKVNIYYNTELKKITLNPIFGKTILIGELDLNRRKQKNVLFGENFKEELVEFSKLPNHKKRFVTNLEVKDKELLLDLIFSFLKKSIKKDLMTTIDHFSYSYSIENDFTFFRKLEDGTIALFEKEELIKHLISYYQKKLFITEPSSFVNKNIVFIGKSKVDLLKHSILKEFLLEEDCERLVAEINKVLNLEDNFITKDNLFVEDPKVLRYFFCNEDNKDKVLDLLDSVLKENSHLEIFLKKISTIYDNTYSNYILKEKGEIILENTIQRLKNSIKENNKNSIKENDKTKYTNTLSLSPNMNQLIFIQLNENFFNSNFFKDIYSSGLKFIFDNDIVFSDKTNINSHTLVSFIGELQEKVYKESLKDIDDYIEKSLSRNNSFQLLLNSTIHHQRTKLFSLEEFWLWDLDILLDTKKREIFELLVNKNIITIPSIDLRKLKANKQLVNSAKALNISIFPNENNMKILDILINSFDKKE